MKQNALCVSQISGIPWVINLNIFNNAKILLVSHLFYKISRFIVKYFWQ